jgi:hypothetical protein
MNQLAICDNKESSHLKQRAALLEGNIVAKSTMFYCFIHVVRPAHGLGMHQRPPLCAYPSQSG